MSQLDSILKFLDNPAIITIKKMKTNNKVVNLSSLGLLMKQNLNKFKKPNLGKISKTNIPEYDLVIDDPFLENTPLKGEGYNLDNLLDWYKTKNPDFKPIGEVNPQIPEFNIICTTMIKDICLFIINNTLPSNESIRFKKIIPLNEEYKTILLKLLERFNIMVVNGYHYLDFISVMLEYLFLFNYGIEKFKNLTNLPNNTRKNINNNRKVTSLLRKIRTTEHKGNNNNFVRMRNRLMYQKKNSSISILNNIHYCSRYIYKLYTHLVGLPFILYPSSTQINFTKVLLTCQAPFINFRLSNRRKIIHGIFENPIIEIDHDVFFHGNLTHLFIITRFNLLKEEILKKETTLSKIYDNVSNIINQLKIILNNTGTDTNEKLENLLLTILFFLFIHETFNSDIYKSIFLCNNIEHFINLVIYNLYLQDESNPNLYKFLIIIKEYKNEKLSLFVFNIFINIITTNNLGYNTKHLVLDNIIDRSMFVNLLTKENKPNSVTKYNKLFNLFIHYLATKITEKLKLSIKLFNNNHKLLISNSNI